MDIVIYGAQLRQRDARNEAIALALTQPGRLVGPTANPKQEGETEMRALAKPLLFLGLMGAAVAAVPNSASAQIFVRPAVSFGFVVPYAYPAYWGTYGYYGYRPYYWRPHVYAFYGYRPYWRPYYWRPRFYGFYGYRPYFWRHAYGFYRPYWRYHRWYGWYGYHRPYWRFYRPYWGYHRYGWYGYRAHWRHYRRF